MDVNAAAPVAEAGAAQAPAAANQNPNAAPPGGPAATPVQTPAAAPAAVPTAAQAPAAPTADGGADSAATAAPNTDPKKGDIVAVRWEKTGYTGLDAGLEFIGKLGFSDKSPEFKAAENGDWAPFELYFLQNPVPGWETYLRIAKESLGEAQGAVEAKRQAVHNENMEFGKTLFGDEAGVNEALAFVDANAEPHEVTALQGMLSAGGITAQAALLFIQTNMKQAGHSYGPQESVTTAQTGAGKPGAAGEPISRMEFAAECKKLRGRFGEDFENTQDYKRLAARLR